MIMQAAAQQYTSHLCLKVDYGGWVNQIVRGITAGGCQMQESSQEMMMAWTCGTRVIKTERLEKKKRQKSDLPVLEETECLANKHYKGLS